MAKFRIAAHTMATVAVATTTGCLEVRTGHCLITGGDFSPGLDPRVICIVPEEEADRRIGTGLGHYRLPDSRDRWTAPAPFQYLRARFGLPRALGSPDSAALSTMYGVFAAAVPEDQECQPSALTMATLWSDIAAETEEFYDRADGRSRTRLSAVPIPRRVLVRLELALVAEIDRCIDEGETTLGSGGSDDGSSTDGSGSTGGSSSTSTGDVPCKVDAECPSSAPVCGDDGQCGACDTAPQGAANEACEAADPTRPLCVDGECVECSAQDDSVCVNPTPTCGEANVCVGCDAHEQCGDAACNLFTGECLPDSAETVVRVGVGADFGTLTEALAAYPEGKSGYTIWLDDTVTYSDELFVQDGRVVALLAEQDAQPQWSDPSGVNPVQLTVEAGATALVHRLRIVDNNGDRGVVVRGKNSRLWVDRSTVSRNDGGGILAEDGAELMVRNSFIGDFDTSANALTVDSSTATVLYSTLGAGFDFGDTFALSCTNPVDVTIRNSLLVSLDDAAEGEVSCAGAEITYNASETVIAGADDTNVVLGEVQPDWFADAQLGDFRLDTPPPELATTALWEPGHPLVDLGGDPRPVGPDNADYAGADVP